MTMKALIVDEDLQHGETCARYLVQQGLDVTYAPSGEAALEEISHCDFHIQIVDLSLRDMDAAELIRRLCAVNSHTKVIAISQGDAISAAVDVARSGAHAYLGKPVSAEQLYATIENMKPRCVRDDECEAEGELVSMGGFIGSSQVMQNVYRTITQVAPSSANVFITGESGTGKEVCAEEIHRNSARADGPFVAINCGNSCRSHGIGNFWTP